MHCFLGRMAEEEKIGKLKKAGVWDAWSEEKKSCGPPKTGARFQRALCSCT